MRRRHDAYTHNNPPPLTHPHHTPTHANTADYFMQVLQLGPHEVDEQGKQGSDLPALWLEKGEAFGVEEGEGDASSSSAAEAAVVGDGAAAADLKELDLGYTVPRWYQVSPPMWFGVVWFGCDVVMMGVVSFSILSSRRLDWRHARRPQFYN
jgi:hypothetical protein